MSDDYRVYIDAIDKKFHTRHMLSKPPDEPKRRFYHKRTIHAVDDVTFGVRPGEIFGLLGPNGAGKTTTVKMLSGLVRPDTGKILVDGFNVETQRRKVLRKVGVVLEGTRTCIWPLTPMENLTYFGNLKAVRGGVLKERAEQLLKFIGLEEKMDVQVRRLSRGQKQKLAICISLIADPSVLLLDEPTTGLDVQSSRSIKDRLREMAREHGRTVLVTTHDMHVAQELCDRIGIIHRGKLVACKPTEELIELFSNQTYAFALDRLPDRQGVETIDGVMSVEFESIDDPTCVVQIDPALEARSRTLYELIAFFKASGLSLRSVSQRQTNLETVFLRLTGDGGEAQEMAADYAAEEEEVEA